MTEHIIQFGVGIDDDAIIKAVKDKAETVIIRDLEKAVLEKIFESRYYSRGVVSIDWKNGIPVIDKDAVFTEFAKCVIEETVEQYKDEIIDKAAEMLTESFKRTKAWKEAVNGVVKDGNE